MADSSQLSINNNTKTTTYTAGQYYEEGGDRRLVELAHAPGGSTTGGGGTAYNVKTPPYNAKGDGVSDDTAAIQSAINDVAANGGGYLYIPKGTYMINAVTSLILASNMRIILDPQAVLQVIPNNQTSYNIFRMNNISNVMIEGNGGTLLGDKATHTTAPAWQASTAYAVNAQVNANGFIYQCTTAGTSGTTSPTGAGTSVSDGSVVWNYVYSGEAGMMVNMTGCTNIFIENLTCKNAWGDGFYIGGGTGSNCENVFLLNCTADGNRRNGVSITNGKNIHIFGGEFKNTAGTNPQFGIDVEPNSGSIIQNVTIKNIRTSNNLEGGIALIPRLLRGGTTPCDITVSDWISDGDGLPQSLSYGCGLVLNGNVSTASALNGSIEINKASIFNSDVQGVYIQGWFGAPRAHFKDVYVYNSNTYVSAYAPSQAGFGMDYNSNDASGFTYGNVIFERCAVIDTRGTPLTKYAFGFYSVSGRQFNNISIIDPLISGVTSTTGAISWTMPATPSGFTARYNVPNTVSLSTAQTITGYAGQEIIVTAAVTMTLPTAASAVGSEFIIRYGAASGTVTLSAQTGETIVNKGVGAQTLALTVAGTFARVRSIGGTQWVVVEQNIS